MSNMVDYVREYRFTLAERPFTRVDSLVLSELAYLRYEGCGLDDPAGRIPLGALAAETGNDALFHNVPGREIVTALLAALADSPRFAGIVATGYQHLFDERAEMQFAAVTYLMDGAAYIAFRGTDSTLIGWKEDLNMATLPSVPAQHQGVAYLEAVARQHAMPLLVGGHSKGGNVAVYAAACCDPGVQSGIRAVFSHDGPGYQQAFIALEGYARIHDRIDKTVPEFSVVGMLLHQQEHYTVVQSNRRGIHQHSTLSWLIDGGDFVVLDGVKQNARRVARALTNWSEALDAVQRQACIDAFFKVMLASGATSLGELASAIATNMPAVIRAIAELPPETRHLFGPVLRTFIAAIGTQVRDGGDAAEQP